MSTEQHSIDQPHLTIEQRNFAFSAQNISSFRNEHFFLSNFYPIQINVNGKTYASAEHAFQAAKCANESDEQKVRMARTPANAKSIGRHVQLKLNWELDKIGIMEKILRIKFSDSKMKVLLSKTKDFRIVEKILGMTFIGACAAVKHINRLAKISWASCSC